MIRNVWDRPRTSTPSAPPGERRLEERPETVAFGVGCHLTEQLPDVFVRRQVEAAHGGRVEAPPDAAHRMHLETLGDLRLVPDETPEARSQRGGQRIGEGGQQNTALRMRARQAHRPMGRHDGLAGAGRARDARRTAVSPFDDVAEQEAGSGPVDDQPDVATDANGPEVLVLRPVDLVQLQPRMRRVHLQVERRGLDGPLLVTGQLGQAVGERVGDAELHQAGFPVDVRALAKSLGDRIGPSRWSSVDHGTGSSRD